MKKLDNYYVEFCGKQFSISMVLLWVAVTYNKDCSCKRQQSTPQDFVGVSISLGKTAAKIVIASGQNRR